MSPAPAPRPPQRAPRGARAAILERSGPASLLPQRRRERAGPALSAGKQNSELLLLGTPELSESY